MGQVGRYSDEGVFINSTFGQAFEGSEVELPNAACFPGSPGPKLPYVMVVTKLFPCEATYCNLFLGVIYQVIPTQLLIDC